MIEKLVKIQNELKAPKSQFNAFGKYSYRNQEDILEAVKPLLYKHGLFLSLSDTTRTESDGTKILMSTATITDGEKSFNTTAEVIIDVTKKGMSSEQQSGAASSYCRKYCLNGLFLIDDTKDADSTNNHGKAPAVQQEDNKAWLNKGSEEFTKAVNWIKGGGDIAPILGKYKVSKAVKEELETLI
jgi:hypothetical protein